MCTERILESRGYRFSSREWSETALKILKEKYAHNNENTPEDVINRVVDAIVDYPDPRYKMDDIFRNELKLILINQLAAFNSPVYFNVGVKDKPQVSACYILDIEDSLESILDHIKTEGMIFKEGSGAGTNFSKLRGKGKKLSGGGTSSGVMSFLKAMDITAGTIKSGGRVRRAARIAILDYNHPDIEEFIDCKVEEEKKARALIEGGFSSGMEGEAYNSISFQNSNHSVRVDATFMNAIEEDNDKHASINARNLLKKISKAAWKCGDPGIIFGDNTNEWNPLKEEIVGTNPCGEITFINNSCCNLASINISKVIGKLEPDGSVSPEVLYRLKHIVKILITAQDKLIDMSSYPTDSIEQNSKKYRPLGLGITNLAALLMSNDIPYDSSKGQLLAASLYSFITAVAYKKSIELKENLISETIPSCDSRIKEIIEKHINEAKKLEKWSMEVWKEVDKTSKIPRNFQVTTAAPTGTISLMMDCDTTGIEPLYSVECTKKLIGGDIIKFIPKCVSTALCKQDLKVLSPSEIIALEEHPVFKTAMGYNDKNRLDPIEHLKMMSAIQPNISGGISKTINLPHDATPDDVYHIFCLAYAFRLKSVTIYRDGSKGVQPLTSNKQVKEEEHTRNMTRKRLPKTRDATTHKFKLGGHSGYITAGFYPDGTLGEVFVVMDDETGLLSGLLDAFSIVTSMALQHGVPLKALAGKMMKQHFQPAGFTDDEAIPTANSIVDYVFKWLLHETNYEVTEDKTIKKETSDIKLCPECASKMRLEGRCYWCPSCGYSGGCS